MPKKSAGQTRPKTKRVRFEFHAPHADKVTLAGDFNSWDCSSLPMKRDKTGTWKIGISLAPGRYEYRFLVDGAWEDDPNAEETVGNPFGDQNCVKVVD